jgi:hypothetical protein
MQCFGRFSRFVEHALDNLPDLSPPMQSHLAPSLNQAACSEDLLRSCHDMSNMYNSSLRVHKNLTSID